MSALLNDVADAATPLLNEVQILLQETAQAEPRSGIYLMMGFAPLLRVAAPAPRPAGAAGRPTASGIAARVEEVLTCLILDGRYHAKTGLGMSSTSPVVIALREMSGDDGVLAVAPASTRLFVVRPEYQAAREL